MTKNRIELYRSCYTGVIHDVMRAMGQTGFTLPPNIRPLQPDITLCGPAWTVEGKVDKNADAHQTLLEWTGLLSKAKPGHIWTSQPNSHAMALMGELSAETLHKKGVLGCVIDGALRDSDFILKLGFPSWRTHHTPIDIVSYWLPVSSENDIKIGEVVIRPGDWLHGDRDGMVRIPAEILDEVLEQSLIAMKTESKVRQAILEGTDPQQAYLKYGKF